uniref:Phosphoglucan phosphatase chloroplastic-like n=1 Tax=Tetraselmis sp. GSL018 TaxID=582737 RepID=A0A061S536_9CHLO
MEVASAVTPIPQRLCAPPSAPSSRAAAPRARAVPGAAAPVRPPLSRPRQHRRQTRAASADPRSKSTEYNTAMKDQMGWDHISPFEYYYDRGLYYHEVEPGVLCGSQPRNTSDAEYLASAERVTTILNLQQDRDLEYWGVDIHSIARRCEELGVELCRVPARDFDGDSLRNVLPRAVRALEEALRPPDARVYVHCTAGLGRSPGVCIAHMFWFGGLGSLDEAYEALTSIRPCGPKREAIRGATFDLLSGRQPGEFADLSPLQYASLSEEERHVLRYNVMRA